MDSGFLRVLVLDSHEISKDDDIWDDDVPSFLGRHHRRAGLDVRNATLNSRDADEIAESERLLQEQKNARNEVLKNTLKCKTDRNGADTWHLDQIRGLKRRSNYGDRDQTPDLNTSGCPCSPAVDDLEAFLS